MSEVNSSVVCNTEKVRQILTEGRLYSTSCMPPNQYILNIDDNIRRTQCEFKIFRKRLKIKNAGLLAQTWN